MYMKKQSKTEARPPKLIDRILEDTIMFGGQPCQRRDVLEFMLARDYDPRCVDWFVWQPEAVEVEPIGPESNLALRA